MAACGGARPPPSFAAIFFAPPIDGGPAALYVAGAFLLAATAFSVFQVPYIAMPAEMTDDHDERAVLMSWRMAFVGVAILLSGALAPALVQSQDDAATGYRLMAVAIGAVILFGTLAAFLGTRRAPRSAQLDSGGSLRRQIAVARTNRPFLFLFGAFFLLTLPAGTMLAGAQYMATYTLGDPAAVTPLFACLVGPVVLTMPLWLRAARHLDKRGSLYLSALIFLTGAAALIAVPVLPGTLAGPYFYLCIGIVGAGFAGTQMLPFSMLTDTIALDTARSGKRRAGVFTGLWTAGEMLAMALGSGLYGLVLQAGGFVSSHTADQAAQSSGALCAVVAGMSVLPALLALSSLYFVHRYDLTEERLTALLNSARRAESAEEGTAHA